MTRKRNKPYLTRHDQAPFSKRRRPIPSSTEDDTVTSKPTPPAAVVVMGLSPDCSVLDLKSRFEIYGAISRIRIDKVGVGYVSFRSKESAEAAIAASLDDHFGITIDSKRVQVIWSTDPLAQWRAGVAAGGKRETESFSSSSKLLRSELPLRRHGRGNKLASAVVRPQSSDAATASDEAGDTALPDLPSKGREIIAYDDIL